MSSRLLTTPLDLLLMIIDPVPIKARFALSRSCRALQALLTPILVSHCAAKIEKILRWAAENNRLDLLKCAIAQGAPIPSRHSSLLATAVERGHIKIVRYLLEQKIYCIRSGYDSKMLLQAAVDRGHQRPSMC
ncbi:hypothetical protein DFP73DRAFT_561516 [Morchella snyderi]|nr:hypothetical protein DFP73DRAFT_561516 [Morchella snyderi]